VLCCSISVPITEYNFTGSFTCEKCAFVLCLIIAVPPIYGPWRSWSQLPAKSTPKIKYRPLLVVRNFLFNILAGTCISWGHLLYPQPWSKVFMFNKVSRHSQNVPCIKNVGGTLRYCESEFTERWLMSLYRTVDPSMSRLERTDRSYFTRLNMK